MDFFTQIKTMFETYLTSFIKSQVQSIDEDTIKKAIVDALNADSVMVELKKELRDMVRDQVVEEFSNGDWLDDMQRQVDDLDSKVREIEDSYMTERHLRDEIEEYMDNVTEDIADKLLSRVCDRIILAFKKA